MKREQAYKLIQDVLDQLKLTAKEREALNQALQSLYQDKE